MTLDEIGVRLGADKSSRAHNYLGFYEEMLPDREFKGRLLEIGVMDGLSMRMWREYYPYASITGIDINDKKHLYEHPWNVPLEVSLFQIDGTKPEATKALGTFDIILDDGSHKTSEQQKAFKHLYKNQLSPEGVYVIEDLHTSFNEEYVDSKLTTVEWLAGLLKKGVRMTLFDNGNPKESLTAIIPGGQKL